MDPGRRQGLRQGFGATRHTHQTQHRAGVAPWAEVGAAARPVAASEMRREAAAALAEGLGGSHRAGAGGCHMTTVLCQMMLLSPELWKGPSGSRSVALTDAQADHL